jgi:hypothetical protein
VKLPDAREVVEQLMGNGGDVVPVVVSLTACTKAGCKASIFGEQGLMGGCVLS